MNAAVQAKQQLEIMFMMQPIKPVPLMVNICAIETAIVIASEVRGPKIMPPIVMITSLESYRKKRTMGMRPIAAAV